MGCPEGVISSIQHPPQVIASWCPATTISGTHTHMPIQSTQRLVMYVHMLYVKEAVL